MKIIIANSYKKDLNDKELKQKVDELNAGIKNTLEKMKAAGFNWGTIEAFKPIPAYNSRKSAKYLYKNGSLHVKNLDSLIEYLKKFKISGKKIRPKKETEKYATMLFNKAFKISHIYQKPSDEINLLSLEDIITLLKLSFSIAEYDKKKIRNDMYMDTAVREEIPSVVWNWLGNNGLHW